jgi:GTP cyclohydrolase II
MSNMKYDAMVEAGIKIVNRCSIPDELIPPDSKYDFFASPIFLLCIAHGC